MINQQATRAVVPELSAGGFSSATSIATTRPRRAMAASVARSSAVAQTSGLWQRRAQRDTQVQHIEIDRDVDRVGYRDELVDHRIGAAIEEIERRGEPHSKLAHAGYLVAFDVSEPERCYTGDLRELGDPPQLTCTAETRPVQLVAEVGVRVNVHHLNPVMRGHAGDERKADRVIATDRNQHARLADDLAAASRIRAKLP